MFQKVLIANRGAIACRIEKTLKKMQIASVAVYAKADEDSLHVSGADEAVFLGEGTAQETYLDQKQIIQAAKDTGAEAIHPGYGFLSEHAGFAERCRKEGLVFIGPDPEHMTLFGLKHSARDLAQKADVPLLEGTDLLNSKEEAVQLAQDVGYPLMLKSTAGGGGIGMRICYSEQELLDAYDSVLHLAESNFSDGGMFLEAYIERARHIEVQIFGTSDETISLMERDCSTQRRNQKVIEETPAPGLSEQVRADMLESAETLARTAGYRSAGTVEFLYDDDRQQFFFLEMNTRLQVEHGVTEEIFGIDLVEWMVEEAAGVLQNLKQRRPEASGHSIQARIYAEDCFHDFRPSAGLVDRVQFSDRARNETWLTDGVEVTTLYDPMLAKVIVKGNTRADALQQLDRALAETKIYGITTNTAYIQHVLHDARFQAGGVFTKLLESIRHEEPAIEVIDGGVQTTIQDYPGRTGYWGVGVPPCGAMDPLAFRIGNALLGNSDETPGIEMTLQGGSYRFRTSVTAVLTGADMNAELDGEAVAAYVPFTAEAGSTLKLKKAGTGMRTYLLVAGGFDVPLTLGSAATFTLGQFGGHSGRALRTGDVISLAAPAATPAPALPAGAQPQTETTWTIGVIPGPHCTEEFLQPEYLTQLQETEYEVHFNSSRTGVRLIGPAPLWAREDGGEAGLHPSNIHDNAYAVGTLDLTGDMPILLGPDGPSLGGFVCPVTTASAEFWKLGQLAPGDNVRFQLMTLEEAEQLRLDQEAFLKDVPNQSLPTLQATPEPLTPDYPKLVEETEGRRFPMTIRASGDRYLLVEYGGMELDLKLRFQAHALMQAVENEASPAVIELTPGIRSLQVGIDPLQLSVKQAAAWLRDLDQGLPPLEEIQIESRIVRLPLSWDDPQTQLATERYAKNVRPDAPWCPDNLEFIRRINGLDSVEDVKTIVFDAKYLVMGLGDVYLGAPVAVPYDPRQRLVTTKYNPARTWTPENAVGIGGSYLCVYGMEGPGGYQFVGRTVQMWNRYRQTNSFRDGKPWLLRFFDQIEFYPVSADDLLQLREDFPRGRVDVDIEHTTFSLKDYLAFVEEHEEGIQTFKQHRSNAFQEERMRWKEQGIAEYVSEQPDTEEKPENTIPDGAEAVRTSMPGSIWKVEAAAGDLVEEGDVVAIQESMKMEFPVYAPISGRLVQVEVEPGDEVQPGQLIGAVQTEEVPVK
ncbi:urea carboxylase [Alkalicoccus chagannorensis]|uniref:urea carboxylase n=1 Tax=Alkalicoccus chagannorensis TaxID=427072 RepID=UPI00041FEC83|nr:urea carboxylase [Alkalicoccus chagannorensis]